MELKNIVQEELTKLNIYSHNLNDHFKHINIYILDKNKPGNQIHIKFDKHINGEFYMSNQYYTKFLKKENEIYNISMFGYFIDIITQLILNEINNKFNYSSNEVFTILFERNTLFNKNIPKFENAIDYIHYREPFNSTFDKCPICLYNYDNYKKIVLDCSHYVCVNCYSKLILQNTMSCPTCRSPINIV